MVRTARTGVRDAVLAGDVSAWRAWFAEHFDRLAAYVRWRCGGLADLADDVTQDVWLTAVRRLRSFDPDRGPFFGWLFGIAANATRNALRPRRRYERRARPLGPTDDLPASGADPVALEKAERVATALAELPDHYEAVLRAKYLDRQRSRPSLRRAAIPEGGGIASGPAPATHSAKRTRGAIMRAAR